MTRCFVFASAALLGAAFPSAAQDAIGIPVAEFEYVEGSVEVAGPDGDWTTIETGGRLRTADRVRSGPRGMARLAFPWMEITLSADSVLSTPGERVLRVNFDHGRIEIAAEEAIIKVVTSEAEVRGRGRAVVRRDAGATVVTAMRGSVTVDGGGGFVTLAEGEGTIVRAGQPPTPPRPAPGAPRVVFPDEDPVYVAPGETLHLEWAPEDGRHHLQVLGIDSDDVLLEMDIDASPQPLQLPWIGTYRWRVARIDPEGLEGRASGEGLICVVDE